jgi:hypothetical protein
MAFCISLSAYTNLSSLSSPTTHALQAVYQAFRDTEIRCVNSGVGFNDAIQIQHIEKHGREALVSFSDARYAIRIVGHEQ